MSEYRVEVLDGEGRVVADAPTDMHTLDGVLAFQLRRHAPSHEIELLRDQLQAGFPNRRILILTPGIEIVRLVAIPEGG